MYNGRVIDTPSMTQRNQGSNQYTSVLLDPEFDLDLSGNGTQKPQLTSTIHTFQRRQNKVYGRLRHAVKPMLSIRSAKRTFALMVLNILVVSVLFSWCGSSNSVALRAFSYLAVFDLLTLITCLTSIWATTKHNSQAEDGVYVFSHQRIEILMVFASVVMSALGAVFILKESLLRILDQPDVAVGRLLPGAFIGFFFHILLTFSIKNKPLLSVTEASSSSVIQEHVSDLSQPLCTMIPFLNRVLQPRVDPFFLLSAIGTCLVLLSDILIQIDLYFSADTVASVLVACCTMITMWPIAVCSGRVLLNTTPPYVLGQLDKLLSEAQTLDGVLEIRNEHFHTIALSPSKSRMNLRLRNGFGLIMTGSIVVRVRRDADEQMVLAHVTNRLSPLVTQLTVQVVKDNWNTGNVATPGLSSNISLKSPIGSSIIYGFNKPAAAVAPYQQTPPRKPPSVAPSIVDMGLKPAAEPSKVPSAPKSPQDDFSFSSTPAIGQTKATSYSSAGNNIARMYKAAGFTSPPPASSTKHLLQPKVTKRAAGAGKAPLYMPPQT